MHQTNMGKPSERRVMKFAFVLAALVAVSLWLTAGPAHAATTFTVNSTGDVEDVDPGDGVCDVNNIPGFEACTLRAAIQEANAIRGKDTISFDIGGGSGVKTISPNSVLPAITDPVVIDGYTQPGASPNTLAQGTNAVLKIELNGANAGAQARGLAISTSNSVVRGLVINRFDGFGVDIVSIGSKVERNEVEGNFIGTDPSGTLDEGNGRDGVFDNSNGNNIIGGTSPEARNIISGNGRGLLFLGKGSNKVQGNLIGTQKNGTSALDNLDEGVRIFSSPNNTIGGAEVGAANTIAFNGRAGVSVINDASIGNRVLSNSIFSNGDLGIDLGGDGRTANDPKDPDTGPNALQNFPVLASATTSSGTTTVTGTLNSTPSSKHKKRKFTIQFFSNPSGTDIEGKKFIGQTKVTTNRQGNASFTFVPEEEVLVGEAITATATSGSGSTSEFSDPLAVS